MERRDQFRCSLRRGGTRMTSKAQKEVAKPAPKNLIVLVADKNTSFAIQGIFTRPQALGVRPLQYDIKVHPEHDPGCLTRSVGLLKLYLKSHQYALVIFDRQGCGQDKQSRG